MGFSDPVVGLSPVEGAGAGDKQVQWCEIAVGKRESEEGRQTSHQRGRFPEALPCGSAGSSPREPPPRDPGQRPPPPLPGKAATLPPELFF